MADAPRRPGVPRGARRPARRTSSAGRRRSPTPARLSEELGQFVWLKREDLAHTGAHKINNALGQVLLARHLGQGADHRRDRRRPARGGHGHGVRAARVPLRRLHGGGGHAPPGAQRRPDGAPRRRGPSRDGGHADAEGGRERGDAGLGRLGAHDPLRDRLGRGAAPVPGARARPPAGDRRRGSRPVRRAPRPRSAVRARLRRRRLERDRDVHRVRRARPGSS